MRVTRLSGNRDQTKHSQWFFLGKVKVFFICFCLVLVCFVVVFHYRVVYPQFCQSRTFYKYGDRIKSIEHCIYCRYYLQTLQETHRETGVQIWSQKCPFIKSLHSPSTTEWHTYVLNVRKIRRAFFFSLFLC